MSNRKNPATTRIPALTRLDEVFSKQEVADMLGAPLYQVSRDCSILWGDDIRYLPLEANQVRTIYCVTMYRHVEYSRGRSRIPDEEIYNFINDNNPDAIWAVVNLARGSIEDCNAGIEEMQIKRNQRRIQQETINVSSTVA